MDGANRQRKKNKRYRSVITNASEDGRVTSPTEADATAETGSRGMAQRSDIFHHPLASSSPPRPPRDGQGAGDIPLMTRNGCKIPLRKVYCGVARQYLMSPVGPTRVASSRGLAGAECIIRTAMAQLSGCVTVDLLPTQHVIFYLGPGMNLAL